VYVSDTLSASAAETAGEAARVLVAINQPAALRTVPAHRFVAGNAPKPRLD
jgi:hypothetical protein